MYVSGETGGHTLCIPLIFTTRTTTEVHFGCNMSVCSINACVDGWSLRGIGHVGEVSSTLVSYFMY